jgi:hypothetical protein
MSERELPDPGEGWRLASGDDCKDRRCEVWDSYNKQWNPRSVVMLCMPFAQDYYRIPIDLPAATGIEAIVCRDIAARQQTGISKYGTTVADNPLSLQQWLQHAYEECLDQAVYLRRAITEIETKEATK